MTAPPFDPTEDLPPDGAEWRGTLPGLTAALGVRTWRFDFPHWSSTDDQGRGPLICRVFDAAGQDITRRWAEEQAQRG